MEMFAYGFMQKALIASFLLGLVSAVAGFFVVIKRLSFIGAGISHSAFGGIALGLVTGLNPLGTAGVFAVLMALFLAWVSRRGGLSEDTAIGIFFSGAMAFGVALLSLGQGYYGDAMSYLFGNILAVSSTDLWLLAGAGALVLFFLLGTFKALLCLCFDEELALASGLPVELLYYGLMVAVALTVVVAAQTVGIVLASALLVTPAATGYQLAKGYKGMMGIAIVSGLLSSFLGLWLSYQYGLASGAAIVLCATAIFFLSFLFSPRKTAFSRLKEVKEMLVKNRFL